SFDRRRAVGPEALADLREFGGSGLLLLAHFGDEGLEGSGARVALGGDTLVEGLRLTLGESVEVGDALGELGAHRVLLETEAFFGALESGLDGAHLAAEEDVADLIEALGGGLGGRLLLGGVAVGLAHGRARGAGWGRSGVR